MRDSLDKESHHEPHKRNHGAWRAHLYLTRAKYEREQRTAAPRPYQNPTEPRPTGLNLLISPSAIGAEHKWPVCVGISILAMAETARRASKQRKLRAPAPPHTTTNSTQERLRLKQDCHIRDRGLHGRAGYFIYLVA